MMNLPPELQSALLGRRVVFLRGRLDEANANNVIAQLLLVARTASGSRTPVGSTSMVAQTTGATPPRMSRVG